MQKANEHILYFFIFSVHLFAVFLLHLECRPWEMKTLPIGFTAVPWALRHLWQRQGRGLDDLNLRRKEFKVRKQQERPSSKSQIYLPPNLSLNQGTCVGYRAIPEHPNPSENYLTTPSQEGDSTAPLLSFTALIMRAASGWPGGWDLRNKRAGEPRTFL